MGFMRILHLVLCKYRSKQAGLTSRRGLITLRNPVHKTLKSSSLVSKKKIANAHSFVCKRFQSINFQYIRSLVW